MHKFYPILLFVFLLCGDMYSRASMSQDQEQVLGFNHGNIYCKISYSLDQIGKGEYIVSATLNWINENGKEKENPGVCIDLLFDKSPINSVEITSVGSYGLYKYERTEIKYLIKVKDDSKDIHLSVDPLICKDSKASKGNSGLSISKSIPGEITFTFPAGILSPHYLSKSPNLVLVNEQFQNDQRSNYIHAGESAEISFDILNKGIGIATQVEIYLSVRNHRSGLIYPVSTMLGHIPAGDTAHVCIRVSGSPNLASGIAEFKIEAREGFGFNAAPLYLKVETLAHQPPDIFISDYAFSTDGAEQASMNFPINLKVVIQNKGHGEAHDYKVKFKFINPSCINLSENPDGVFDIASLRAGEYQIIDYLFIITRAYQHEDIPIQISIFDGYTHVMDTIANIGLDEPMQERITNVYPGSGQQAVMEIKTLSSYVDKNIPETGASYYNKFALIIGNEDYAKYQKDLETESNVIFADNDARIFKKYANNIFGVPESNTYLLINATAGEMQQKINLITKRAEKFNVSAEIIVFYAGHGYPGGENKSPYLVPVDVSAKDLSLAINLGEMLHSLQESRAARIIVFLDACFTGEGRNSGLLASRGIRIKPYAGEVPDNVLLFSASSALQAALPYNDEYHGMFTFYLLEKLWNSSGSISYGELFDYLHAKISENSLLINEKEQDPDVRAGSVINDIWRSWYIR